MKLNICAGNYKVGRHIKIHARKSLPPIHLMGKKIHTKQENPPNNPITKWENDMNRCFSSKEM